MNEQYLHLLWKLKRLPMTELYLTDGRKLEVIDTGWHNTDAAGPDFFNGSIRIDGLTWNGNIEIHVNASDWYAHKHDRDPAYNNVVLHVVFKDDKAVFINQELVPTLELSPLIDFIHWNKFRQLQLSTSWIPCENQFKQVNPVLVRQQVDQALFDRLERKAELLEKRFVELDHDKLQLSYEVYAKVFGLKVNELPFVELTRRLPLKLLWKTNMRYHSILVYGVAGFFEQAAKYELEAQFPHWEFLQKKHQLQVMDLYSWKFKGLRPSGFPPQKLSQFARFCANQSHFRLEDLSAQEIIRMISEQFEENESIRTLICINACVQLLWWQGGRSGTVELKEKALELLNLHKAESNKVIDKWKKTGAVIKSSFDSQGYLELKNEICNKKKCLQCKIGYHLLKNGQT